MAVFTKLERADFASVLENYDLGDLIDFSGISEGVENTNYIVETQAGKYILTIYEKRVSGSDLPFFVDLMSSLSSHDFPCPVPIANKNGKIINNIYGKNYTIVTMLKGRWSRTVGNNEVAKAGEALAKFHNTSEKFAKNLFRKNSMGKIFWKETYEKVSTKTRENFRSHGFIDKGFALVENSWAGNLPGGIIHGDYFPDNVLFDNGEVSGVIDLYMACNDYYAYDLAIALNAWCFEKDFAFNITKAKLLLEHYQQIRKLSDAELQALPVLCVGASLRFLSTRLYDYFNREEGAVVNVKDPNEYLEKLKFHLQINSYKEYGL